LITGASGVIGRALLRRLWAEPAWAGVAFYLAGRDAQGLAGLVAEADALGLRALAWPLDLAERTQVDALIERLQSAQPLRGLALVAGINHDDPLPRLSEAAWQRVWDVNTGAHARLLRALDAPGRLAAGSRGILVGSQVGLRGNAGQAAYAAAKGALLDLLPLGPQGLRLNLLLPPLVDSPLLANLSQAAREQLYRVRLLQDPDPAASCARAGAFLLSDDAAYIHRQVLHADSRVSVLGWDLG
jgi:3-oxoacyl-[acyl-carrier protein] reductase